MKEMNWSWEDYLSAPVHVVEFIVEQVRERAEEHERAKRKAALKGNKL